MFRRFNLFTVFFYGGVLLFGYCLVKALAGEVMSAIHDPLAYFEKLSSMKDQDYTIFDFLGLLLDQLM